MKRTTLPALLCIAALLTSGCAAQTPETPELSTQTAEPVETAAVTESPAAETEPATAPETFGDEQADTEAEDSVPDAEQALREKESQARQAVDAEKAAAGFEEKKASLLETGVLVEGAESWQDGYAKLLTSGDAVYLGETAPTAALELSYQLLFVEDSDIPNLVIDVKPDGHVYINENVLFFRYEDGTVRYADSCYVDKYAYSFLYRPYRGDIGYTDGSVMGDGIFCSFRHLGGSQHYYVRETGWGQAEDPITEEIAEEYGLTFDAETGTGSFDESWVKVAPSEVFKPVTPETIALLYNES